MTDYQNLSENELRAVIERAEIALKNKQANKRKETIAKIKELAASIDAHVEIYEDGKKNCTSRIEGSHKISRSHRPGKNLDRTGYDA